MAYRSRVVLSERSRRDLLLCFGWAQVTFGLVGGGRDGGVGEEPQHVGFPVLEAFQRVQGGRLLAFGAGHAADGGRGGVDAVPEQARVPGDRLIGDDGQSLAACQVGDVDEGAQFAAVLPGQIASG